MNSSRQLKIWTLIAQAFIIVGSGHGAAPLILLEIVGFSLPFENEFFQKKLDQAIFSFGLITLSGQAITIASIFSNSTKRKLILHIMGIILLSGATLFIGAVIEANPYSVILYLTCVPFFICVLLTVSGKLLTRIWHRQMDSF